MYLQFDKDLALYCGPAMAGIKAANLMSCSQSAYPDLQEFLPSYAKALAQRGITLRKVCSCNDRLLLLVYRQALLEKQLQNPQVLALLAQDGYPISGTMEDLLSHLEHRLATSCGFPHEIGLFLGYPVEDVVGFQIHRGQNFKYCGHWKVYGDVEKSCRLFHQFDRCRKELLRRVSGGQSILQIFTPRPSYAYC